MSRHQGRRAGLPATAQSESERSLREEISSRESRPSRARRARAQLRRRKRGFFRARLDHESSGDSFRLVLQPVLPKASALPPRGGAAAACPDKARSESELKYPRPPRLSLIHISEPTRLGMISY